MSTPTSTIKWTTRNTRAVREFLKEAVRDHTVANFIPRRSKDMTETLWLNIADEDWPKYASAAVYDPKNEVYLPVETGEWIVLHTDNSITVSHKRPEPTTTETETERGNA